MSLHASLRDAHRFYVRRMLPQSWLVRSFICDTAPGAPVGTCVEIGSGSAPFEDVLRSAWRPAAYMRTDRFPGSRTDIAADAAALPFADGSVGLIAGFQLLQHVENPDAVLRDAARVLPPGGWLLLTYPFLYGECDVRDFRRWTQEGIARDCAAAGFETVTQRKIGGPLFMLCAGAVAATGSLLPGRRAGWRGSGSRAGTLRTAAVTLLASPFHMAGWPALLLDRIWPGTPFYMGGAILLRKRTP